ncbi:MAG: hypothetical protein ACFFCO_13125 [Promethearchaeota archaeon]
MVFVTQRVDWVFLVPASLVFFSGLIVTRLEFLIVHGLVFQWGLVHIVGHMLCLAGFTLHA